MNKKLLMVTILLLGAIILSFALPKAKYKSLNILHKLKIPYEISNWQGKDVAKELDLTDERYKFISEIFARIYTNENKESFLLLILDAGNFHNPKVCFGSSGYKMRELSDPEFNVGNRNFKAKTLYLQKGKEGLLLLYWICIDKKQVHWTEQKLKEFWYSLFGKKRVGLMVRLDIPTREDNIKNSLRQVKKFIEDLSYTLPSEQAEYLFGE